MQKGGTHAAHQNLFEKYLLMFFVCSMCGPVVGAITVGASYESSVWLITVSMVFITGSAMLVGWRYKREVRKLM